MLIAKLRSALDALRGSYWFLPMVMAFAAGGAAVAMVRLDRSVGPALIRTAPWIGTTGPEGARAVLSVIAGSMITVTGVVFSVVVVALTLASSQFGPRLLRNFLRDRTNQIAFGTFVATFLYGLVVLRSVRNDEVPQLATALGVVLATVSLFVLIYFIHHIATSIEASSVIAEVSHEISRQIPRLFPEGIGEPTASEASVEAALQRLSADGKALLAKSDGFIRVVDDESVMSLAREHDLTVALHQKPGDFVAAGTALAQVGPVDRLSEEIFDAIRESFVFGDHRTPVQDLGFLVNQLTEIAVRALSPGVNDPRTASDCVHRLGAVVCALADREMPSGARLDADGTLRVITPHVTFEQMVAMCFDPLRRYGGSHVSIVVALLEAIAAAVECCPDVLRREVLASHAKEIYEGFTAGNVKSARDLAEAQAAKGRAMRHLG